MVVIRPSKKSDRERVRAINDLAFGRTQESALIRKLRMSGEGVKHISYVAEVDHQVIGHVLFTEVALKEGRNDCRIMVLAPLSVLPSYQNQGIGSDLVKEGLREVIGQGCKAVVVVGPAAYYQKMGFEPAETYGILPPEGIDRNNFMVYFADEAVKNHIKGQVKYPEAFEIA